MIISRPYVRQGQTELACVADLNTKNINDPPVSVLTELDEE